MSDKIKLTPAMLIQQGAQLKSVSDSYKTTVRDVEKVLNGINGNWSKNLANNFSGKITETTKVTNALTDTLDKTVSLIDNVGNQFESFDHQLAKMIGGVVNDAKDIGAAVKGNGENPIKSVYDIYDNLPKEYRDFIDLIAGQVIGGEKTKAIKLLTKWFAGEGEWKDAWTVGDIIVKIASKNSTKSFGLSKMDVIFTTVKTFYSKDYQKQISKYEDIAPWDWVGVGRYLASQAVVEGKLLTDVTCQLVDKVFKLSTINTVLKICYKIDLGKGFNNYTKVVNSYWDNIVSGDLFTKKGAADFITSAKSIFDVSNYKVTAQ